MEALAELLQDGFFVVLACIIQIIVVVAGGYAISLLRKANKNTGLTTTEQLFKQIEKTIGSIVIATNQTIVTKLKESNPNGKLTDEQKDMIFNTVKTAVLACLSEEEVKAIVDRYFDIDDGLLYLIETHVTYNHVTVTPVVGEGTVIEDDTVTESCDTTISTGETSEEEADMIPE